MKPLTLLASALLLLSPAVLTAADFEGTVKMNMTAGPREKPMPMSFSLKSGLTRMDFASEGHSGAMIMNPKKREVMILMPEQQMYMVHPIPEPGMNGPAPEMNEDAKIEKTDVHEKILGYDTTKYIITSRDGTTEVWVTDQLGTFMGLGTENSMGGMAGRRGRAAANRQAWEEAFKGKEAFPLRVITTGKNGKDVARMEVTAIDKKSLPDSLFQPPAGYQKFDMGGMMRGMGLPGMPQQGG